MSARPPIPSALGAAVTPLNPGRADLRIEIVEAPARERAQQEAIDRRWAARCAANPRLFDGPILSVVRIDPGAPGGVEGVGGIGEGGADTIVCVRETFKSLCAQPEVPTGVRLLGVNGVIIGRDARGVEHVLLGRRGHETRVYDGMWELAPGGGVDAPPASLARPGLAYLRTNLAKEAREELGMEVDASHAAPVAVTHDQAGLSDIVSLRLELPGPIDPRWSLCQTGGGGGGAHDWEYIDAAWLARPDAPAFDARHAHAIIPPTRAMLRFLAWLP